MRLDVAGLEWGQPRVVGTQQGWGETQEGGGFKIALEDFIRVCGRGTVNVLSHLGSSGVSLWESFLFLIYNYNIYGYKFNVREWALHTRGIGLEGNGLRNPSPRLHLSSARFGGTGCHGQMGELQPAAALPSGSAPPTGGPTRVLLESWTVCPIPGAWSFHLCWWWP